MKIVAIIPAKLDSKRLEKKNIQLINGKPMVEFSIDYAKRSKHNIEIIISSEAEELAQIAEKNKVKFMLRDKSLCGDVEVVDVYIHILNSLEERYDLMIALQPDHPDREHELDTMIDYMVDNNYDDLITVEPSYKRSGSVRIFKYDHIMNSHVSKRIGIMKDDATDIHYSSDLEIARKRLSQD